MIPIQNVYYMLAYAYRALQKDAYKKLASEEFKNVEDLLSAILCQGISIQVKRGLGKAYIEKSASLSSPRGKIDITNSVKTQSILKKQLVCTFDEFSVNSYINRILKTAMCSLLKSNLSKSRKKEICNLLVFFQDVDLLDKRKINWNLQYDRNNQTYHMLVSVCEFIIKGLLQANKNGNFSLADFIDDQNMHTLYEKFLLEFYKKEHPNISASAPYINWKTDGYDYLLPQMKTDIVISNKKTNKTLIIDAKYYKHNLQTNTQHMTKTIYSGNLYQIFTYVKNRSTKPGETVSGMLLYAKTDDSLQPHNQHYAIDGNDFYVKTLDLNCDFSEIRNQLDTIAKLISN